MSSSKAVKDWMREYENAVDQAEKARRQLRVWNSADINERGTEAQMTRRLLGGLGGMLDDLDGALINIELDRRSHQITENELTRRRGLIEKLKDERREMAAILKEGPSQRDELLGSDWDLPADNLSFSDMSTKDIVHHQRNRMLEEDEALDTIHSSLVRQRGIGEAIGSEVTDQTHLLEGMSRHVDESDVRVQVQNEKIKQVTASAGNCCLWITMAILAIVLIIILATDGGCYIIKSKEKCKADHASAAVTNSPLWVFAIWTICSVVLLQ